MLRRRLMLCACVFLLAAAVGIGLSLAGITSPFVDVVLAVLLTIVASRVWRSTGATPNEAPGQACGIPKSLSLRG